MFLTWEYLLGIFLIINVVRQSLPLAICSKSTSFDFSLGLLVVGDVRADTVLGSGKVATVLVELVSEQDEKGSEEKKLNGSFCLTSNGFWVLEGLRTARLSFLAAE